MQERIHINHAIRDRLKNNIEQLKGNVLESITPEVFHLIENIHQKSNKKSFDSTKKRHIRKFDESINNNKVRHSATNIAVKKMGYLYVFHKINLYRNQSSYEGS